MDLESAPNEDPVSRSGKPYFAVLMSGLFTTAATLAGVYWLGRNAEEFHIMGWYANYVIPVGGDHRRNRGRERLCGDVLANRNPHQQRPSPGGAPSANGRVRHG